MEELKRKRRWSFTSYATPCQGASGNEKRANCNGGKRKLVKPFTLLCRRVMI